MTITIKLGAIVATALLMATAAASEIEVQQQQTKGDAGLAGQTLAPAADASSELGVPEPESLAPAATAEETKSTTAAGEAEARGLKAARKDEVVPVRICRREKTTGTRLGRKRCRSLQELQRAADLQGAQLGRDSSQFKRTPFKLGGGGKKSKTKF